MTVVKKQQRKRNVQRKSKLSGLDIAISRLFTTENPSVTFKFEDNTKLVQPLRDEFLKYDNGKSRSVNQIKNDLFALKHDNGAISFKV